MKGCLRLTGRVAAVGAAVLFVVTLPLTVIGFGVGRVAFSPQLLTTLLRANLVDNGVMRRLMVESLSAGPDPGEVDSGDGLNLREALSFLTPQERDYLGERLTPPGWADDQVTGLVSSLFEWIDNDRARPELTVDMAPVKVSLLGGGASELIETMVDSWPPCSVDEVARMGPQPYLGDGELILCEPPEPLRTGLVGVLEVSVAASLRALPDRISLEGPAEQQRQAPSELMATKEQIRTLRALAEWGWLLSAGLLALILALEVRTRRSLGLWWGVPLGLGAGLTLLAAVGLRAALGRGLAEGLSGPETPEALAAALRPLAGALLAATVRRVAFLSAALLAGGLGLLWVGLRGGKPALPPVPPSEAVTKVLDAESAPEPEPEPPGEPPTGMFG